MSETGLLQGKVVVVSGAGGGIGVSRSFCQSNETSGFCFSSARRTSSSNGARPTFTPGGVRNQ